MTMKNNEIVEIGLLITDKTIRLRYKNIDGVTQWHQQNDGLIASLDNIEQAEAVINRLGDFEQQPVKPTTSRFISVIYKRVGYETN